MKLKYVLPTHFLRKDIEDIEINGLTEDSRYAKRGDLFFIKERHNFDIFSALGDVDAKVEAFIAQNKFKSKIRNLGLAKPVIFVNNIHLAFRYAADKFYNFNKHDFIFIGVTGTKGKTTTAYLIYHILKGLKQQPALISTINYSIADKSYSATNTTPDYLSLRKLFSQAKEAKNKYVVMEVSSHGIKQQRIAGISFSRCVFTNLKREHLDYHKTMLDYFKTKKSFFTGNRNCRAIINIDDIWGRKIIKGIKNSISYAVKSKADFQAKNIVVDKNEIRFNLLAADKAIAVSVSLLGRHNVYNVLAAVATVFSLNFPLRSIIECLRGFGGVEGRMQEVSADIFVDYAHTPDSLEKALTSARDIGYEKVICVFGCGGNRDHGKRKVMGSIASRLADFTIITSDNPRSEDPLEICRQIEKGFSRKNYSIVLDRRQAIRRALKLKVKYANCCLLVAGKGHEDYQIVGDERIPFKDSVVIRELTPKCS